MEPEEYDNIARLEDVHWWYTGMRALAAAWLRRSVWPDLIRPGAPPPRLLDAGCGTGGGLRWLSAQAAATGIDYSPFALAHARRGPAPIAQASVQALPVAAGAFDLVTSFEVLYHLAVTDDAAALREFSRVLRPGGWLLLRVPAHDWLRGAHDRQVHTRRRYSRAGLRHKLVAAGFDIERLSYVGLSLVVPALLRRFTERAARPRSDVTLPPPLVNTLLYAVLRGEGPWLARFNLPAGLSLMALARRPRRA
jgi:SAM-dependent methyltransferase